MDSSGHSQLAEWSGPGVDFERAADAFRAQLEEGYIGVWDHRDGTATQVRAQEEQVESMVDTLYIRLAEVTGREVDEIRADARQGRFFTVPEAVAYGLLDGEARPGDMQRGGRG